MMADPLQDLFLSGWPWGLATLGGAAVLGGLGGIAQILVGDQPRVDGDVVKGAIVGIVATLASLWVKAPPASLVEFVGFCLAIGFFGQVVLATIRTRVTTGLLQDRLAKTASVASAAIQEAAHRSPAPPGMPAAAPRANDPVIEALRVRLNEAARAS